MIESYNRINNIKQRYDNGAQFPEILIANYDMHERERDGLGQMNLFDINNELNKEENSI
jgi:DNA adenine methylase